MDQDIDCCSKPQGLLASEAPLFTVAGRLFEMESSVSSRSGDRRRSYALEDLQQVEKDKQINDLIKRKIDDALKEAMSDVSQKMLEKESAILELKNELFSLKTMKSGLPPCKTAATLPRPPRGPRGDRDPIPGTSTAPSSLVPSSASQDGNGTGAVPKRNLRQQPPPPTSASATASLRKTPRPQTAWNCGPGGATAFGDRQGSRRALKLSGPRTAASAVAAPLTNGDRKGPDVLPVSDQEALKGRMESSSSDDGHTVAPTYQEMADHLRRLTDEHAKLQAEYARVRTLLQDANVKSASSRLNSPVPSTSSGTATDTGEAQVTSAGADTAWEGCEAASGLSRVQHLLRVDVDKLSPEDSGDPGSLESPLLDGFKGGFRREVLRLKEELLVVQKQLASQTDSKNAADQELAVTLGEMDELKRELAEREALVEQLTKHNEQVEWNLHGTVNELQAILRDREKAYIKVCKRLKDQERDTFENKEFMQEENNSLTESLREAEERLECLLSEIKTLEYNVEAKERQYQTLQQVVEQNQTQMQLLQSELHDTKDGTRAILVRQWSELSRCSVSICRLQELVEANVSRMLQEAAALGAESEEPAAMAGSVLSVTPSARGRPSLDGHQLVRAILDAAARGSPSVALVNGSHSADSASTSVSDSPDHSVVTNGDVYANGTPEAGEEVASDGEKGNQTLIGPQLAPQLLELESKIMSLGQMLHASSGFLVNLLEKSNIEKLKIEEKLVERRKTIEDLQTEVEESNRRRWMLEEKNRSLNKELDEAKDSLCNARRSLKDMWDKVNEKATWLIDNKKLKEEVVRLRKTNSLIESERDQVMDQLNEVLAKMTSEEPASQDVQHLKEQLNLQRTITQLQRQVTEREEEMQEANRRAERNQHILSDNLQKAENEVEKLDRIIDSVLKILQDIPDLFERFPELKQLWKDLDGQGLVKSRGQ